MSQLKMQQPCYGGWRISKKVKLRTSVRRGGGDRKEDEVMNGMADQHQTTEDDSNRNEVVVSRTKS